MNGRAAVGVGGDGDGGGGGGGGVLSFTEDVMDVRSQELCESRGGRPGLPAPNSPYGLCGRRRATFEDEEDVMDVKCVI